MRKELMIIMNLISIINKGVELSGIYVTEKDVITHLENVGRVAYKSHDKIKPTSGERFIKMLIKNGHLSVLEHQSFSMKFTTNRAIANQLTRHRLTSVTQESTRYVDMSKEGNMKFIRNPNVDPDIYATCAEEYYNLIKEGVKPEDARDVLPMGLATQLVVTANIREWYHIIELRTHKSAHHQIQELMNMTLDVFITFYPILFSHLRKS